MKQHDPRDSPGVVAPPPLILLAAFLIGLGLEILWPLPLGLGRGVRWTVGGVLIAAAVALAASGIREFRRAGTNLAPHLPATSVVTGGPFGWSRNPLYLSMHLFLAGLAFLCDTVWLLVMLAPFFLAIRHGVIAREERYLEGKFGEDYRRYKARVRRWI
jgi:protein-S-isoprenylcysteine O-methyltransferase Ste14